jgi:hypothetical protein
MPQSSGSERQLVLSYLALRKAVGIIGFFLPLALAIGKMILGSSGLQRSISGYYYSNVRDIFVGSLCAIGVFLVSTKGYDWRDQLFGILAGAFAIGVALFPTTPDTGATAADQIVGTAHLTFAALLFLTFATFCLWLFTLHGPDPTPRKLVRNRVYRICGIIILACIGLLFLVFLPPIKTALEAIKPVFWLESVAVMTFGFAWLTKGEMIWKDQEEETAATASAG